MLRLYQNESKTMTDKYKNKYRIPSARLRTWNYGWNASYFITICTKDRQHYFGDVINGQMHLTEIGKIAKTYWQEIPIHFPFVILDAFIIMPNHVHGIIIINKTVETLHATSLPDNESMSGISPKPGSISTIIRSFKSAVKKYGNINDIDFAWQTRFHDHIIRDEKSFNKIANYIRNNPAKWTDDMYYK